MSKSMNAYEQRIAAEGLLKQSGEMFNEPEAGKFKKGFAIALGVLAAWQRSLIASEAEKRRKDKAKILVKQKSDHQQ